MKTSSKLLCAGAVLSLMISGCCAADNDADGKACAKDGAKTVKKLKTPEGEVIYVVSFWEAEPVCGQTNQKTCPTAKVFKTADGKTFCGKPLKVADDKEKADPKMECYKAPDGTVMAVAGKDCSDACMKWCMKEVKVCPNKGDTSACKAEHVNMPDNQKGCAKADAKKAEAVKKAPADTAVAPDMDDEVVEDDFFIVEAI